jgi:hypothetical protein
LTAQKAPFVEEKSIKSPEMPPRHPSAWVFPDEMKKFVVADNKYFMGLGCLTKA